jgi:hypothetical protein
MNGKICLEIYSLYFIFAIAWVAGLGEGFAWRRKGGDGKKGYGAEL